MADNTVIDGSFVIKCPYCGGNVAEGYVHCPHCGASLAQSAPQPVEPAASMPAYTSAPPPIPGQSAEKLNQRPVSISVISILLMVSGGLSLLSTTCILFIPESLDIMRLTPIPLPIQFAITYTGLIVTIVAGIAIFKGYNWGRWLYVTAFALSWVYGIITSPNKVLQIPSLLVFGVAVFFLFRPEANAYFTRTKSVNDVL